MFDLISSSRDLFKSMHTGLLIFCIGYAGLIVFLNYRFGLEPRILYHIPNRFIRFAGYYSVYLAAFAVPYLFLYLAKGKEINETRFLLLMVLIAPAIFALKVNFTGVVQAVQACIPGPQGRYVAILCNLPSRLIVVVVPLLLIWTFGGYVKPFFGVTLAGFNWKPYALMLLFIVPLIAWASTQHDFLQTYPKLRQVAFIHQYTNRPWLHNLLFEISYGMDFITIELFFRGFLVLAFVRFAGVDAILPMAVFYCSIHFGKPLAECISSFFGGLLLGAVVYKTGNIAGGLMVHLGIAWMMEGGAVAGLKFKV